MAAMIEKQELTGTIPGMGLIYTIRQLGGFEQR
jgi:hypothetical protein